VKPTVTDDILRYLHSHPNAADTLEGILNWWLPRQQRETERERVEQALEYLITQGHITKQTLAEGTILYRKKDRA
jgi:hypothetical protein